MKKICLIIILFSSLTITSFAENLGFTVDSGKIWAYSVAEDGSSTLISSKLINGGGWISGTHFLDESEGKIYFKGGGGEYEIFDYKNRSWLSDTISAPTGTAGDPNAILYQVPWNVTSDGTNTIISSGTDSEDGSVTTVLGSLDIKDSTGNTLIENKADGSTHIGENSLVTIESSGRQQLYATDATGNRIDINIPSGTNLLIDGKDVMGSIDSSIALGAAFASLPTGAEGAGYTCGLGTGFHDSASAISGGCGFDFANYAFVDSMPEMFQKASFNIGAASVVHGEGDDGTLKAGITFKFGAPKPVREARDGNLLLENKIDAVMVKNETIQAENNLLKAQIAEINTQLKALNMVAMD